MSAQPGDVVFVVDSLGYDSRGGTGDVYATLESAMAACSNVDRWVYGRCEVWPGHIRESWCQAMPPDSVSDCTEIRVEVIR